LLGTGSSACHGALSSRVKPDVTNGSFLHDAKAGIEALIIGFLLSPYGLSMKGETVIAFIELINDRIKAI